MTLFEIKQAFYACVKPVVDKLTGEVIGEEIDEEQLQALQMDFDEKVRNIACWMKNLKAEAEALKAQKDAFAARQKAVENKLAGLKEYLAFILDGKSKKDTEYAISFRRTVSSNILNEDAIPDGYKIPQPAKVDKVQLLKDLKAGVEVPGAELKEGLSLTLK